MTAGLYLLPVGFGDRGHAPYIGNEGNGAPRFAPGATILVIEDEVLIRLSTTEFLRDLGYRVIEAANAAEAQSIMVAGGDVDILFSDINMPGPLTGIELAAWVANKYPGVKIILTSGGAAPGSSAHLLRQAHFVSKPYSHESLAAKIDDLLQAS